MLEPRSTRLEYCRRGKKVVHETVITNELCVATSGLQVFGIMTAFVAQGVEFGCYDKGRW